MGGRRAEPPMGPSRRTVLGGGLGVLGVAVVGLEQPMARAATAQGPVRNDFVASVGKTFTVQYAGGTYRLTLTALQDLPNASAADAEYCFSLMFRPAGTSVLPDGIYSPRRSGVPRYSLFLGRVGTGRTLQAVVNRAYSC
jgi:hypothetical protein